MPLNAPQSLTPDEVYAVSAYLLFLNGIVPQDSALDADALPKIKMPNRDGFVAPIRRGLCAKAVTVPRSSRARLALRCHTT